MSTIHNPILPGFNPDPSICRVGDDYYIATSTFEWFPGVQIHHSRDLVHWRLLTRSLTRQSQLDMVGNQDSGGIWAPCLTHADGKFWLIYTDVKTFVGPFTDVHNYLVTADNIEGPWSEPIHLNDSGFDPSLFHDDDGRKWLVNMLWEWRKGKNRFAGIVKQEYSVSQCKLVGPVKNIFTGSGLGFTEGPHLYKKDGWYYLMTAEGGTKYDHAVTFARCRNIDGPYEVQPDNPILTSRGKDHLELQKAGHGSLVQTPAGEWYMVHLCGRPLGPERRCMLGRETAIQKVEWDSQGWLHIHGSGNSPAVEVPGPDLPEHPWPAEPARDDFDSPKLNTHLQTLRVPADESWLSLTARKGYLRMFGRESLISRHHQSLVAHRIQAFRCSASTCVEFEPTSYKQMAGLVGLYNVQVWHYLCVTHDEQAGKCLHVLSCDNRRLIQHLDEPVAMGDAKRIYLRATIDREKFNFSYATAVTDNGQPAWQPIGPTLDATWLSDEYAGAWFYTGSFFGLACQDLAGTRQWADFDYFEYTQE